MYFECGGDRHKTLLIGQFLIFCSVKGCCNCQCWELATELELTTFPFSRPIQPSSDALWMYHSRGLPTNWSGEALVNVVEGMDPVIIEGVENGFAMFPETSMCMSQVTYNPQLTIRASTATQLCTDDLAAPFDQQNNMLSYVSKDSNHQSQTLQQSNIASSMLAGETSTASGMKQGEKVTDSSQAPTTQGRSSTSGQPDCYGIQKGVQPSRLQRAAGIKELTKYVDEMAPIGSSKVEDETLSLASPSLILSSASDNWQATNLFKNSGEQNTQRCFKSMLMDVQLKEGAGCCLSLSFTIHPVH
jgi:hypothetical protein